MDWAALVVSIVAALAAALAAYFAYVAAGDSRRANELAAEANDFSRGANDQAERFFSESGAQIGVNLLDTGEYPAVSVMSVGRLAATVQDVRLEFCSNADLPPVTDIVSGSLVPFTLEPTQMREFRLDRYKLASLSGAYGGTYQWRACAILGDGRKSWSAITDIEHPVEPTLEEMLTTFNYSALGIVRELNLSESLSEERLRTLSELHAQLRGEFPELQARYRALPSFQRSSALTHQLTNGEQRLRDGGSMLAERRR
jgi:hypothetical protein